MTIQEKATTRLMVLMSYILPSLLALPYLIYAATCNKLFKTISLHTMAVVSNQYIKILYCSWYFMYKELCSTNSV